MAAGREGADGDTDALAWTRGMGGPAEGRELLTDMPLVTAGPFRTARPEEALYIVFPGLRTSSNISIWHAWDQVFILMLPPSQRSHYLLGLTEHASVGCTWCGSPAPISSTGDGGGAAPRRSSEGEGGMAVWACNFHLAP